MLPYLPFVAAEGKGLLAYFGVGIDHQVVLLFTSLLGRFLTRKDGFTRKFSTVFGRGRAFDPISRALLGM